MLFFDGAFGTYYYEKTGDGKPCELANLTNPSIVTDIHKEYISAGANAIKTNTFGANRSVYAGNNENNSDNYRQIRSIITAGLALANKAAENTDVKVFADIGYIYGNEYSEVESDIDYLFAAETFIENGASNFLFETLGSFAIIKPALKLIKSMVPKSTIIASFAVSQNGLLYGGMDYRQAVKEAENDENVDIIGLNCVCGPSHLLSLTKRLGKISKPLSIMPNAGYPSIINGRTIFYNNPPYFAEKLLELKKAGAEILGGCCGTTPEHIKCAVNKIKNSEENSDKKKGNVIKKIKTKDLSDSKKLPFKPIAVELDPPDNNDFQSIIDAARRLKEFGVNTITLSDSPLAKGRADSFLTACIVRRETGIDVLPHLTCRDKNYIAIKGSLLGASYEKIDKVLAITGDPIANNAVYKKQGVFNFNSMQLIKYINELNRELFVESPFSVGGALNVNALNFDLELERCVKKVNNGAGFIFSQPIFSEKSAQNFINAKKRLECRLFAGILPVAGYKNAVFLNNEVSGIEIPDEVVESLYGKGRKESYAISVRYSKKIIASVYDYADGFYIMTPLKKVGLVADLISKSFNI